MIKQSDLYNNILYTIVPSYTKDSSIFPKDQSIAPSRVFLWSSYRDVQLFQSRGSGIVLKVKIPEDEKLKNLIPVSSGIYSLPFIDSSWILPSLDFSVYE